MALENADYIWQLQQANPEATDPVAQGDDHLRMIKKALVNSFPGMTAPWVTNQPIGAGDPSQDNHVMTLGYFNGLPQQYAIGWPFLWMLPTLPGADYLDLAGQTLSRAEYPDLFALYGTLYGPGDGVTTFKLPDARGLFLRVQDQGATVDPDATDRTNRGDGTTGDNVGTKQMDALQNHNHTSAAASSGSNTAGGSGVQVPKRDDLSTGGIGSMGTWTAETRPKNIYVRLVIRAK